MRAPEGDTWVGLTGDPLPVAEAASWAVRPDCGANVVFTGTVRDHAPGRSGVTHLVYEAYEEQVTARLMAVAGEARRRWPTAGRIAVLHRVGRLDLGDVSVLVAVSAPHRQEAFEASRFCIDALKATAPIWKLESWSGGEAWSPAGESVIEAREVSS